MSRIRTAILGVVAALLIPAAGAAPAVAAPAPAVGGTPEVYVSPTGNDSNPGTKTRPVRTIDRGFALAQAGTTILLMPGTYTGDVTPAKGGSAAGGLITLKSQVPHAAKIVGGFYVDRPYLRIEGLEITGANVDYAMDVVASHIRLINNKIHHISQKKAGNDNGGSGMEIYTDDYGPLSDIVIDRNMVYDIGLGPGKDELTQGIYLSVKCTGCRVTNNIVFDVTDFGIHSYHSPNGWIVANNTVFNNGRGILTGPNFTVVNNISYGNRKLHSDFDLRGGGSTVAGNMSFGRGKVTAPGVQVADPMFVNYTGDETGDVHLRLGSPALDTGVAGGAPAFDFDRVARPQGNGFDIGAYERPVAGTCAQPEGS